MFYQLHEPFLSVSSRIVAKKKVFGDKLALHICISPPTWSQNLFSYRVHQDGCFLLPIQLECFWMSLTLSGIFKYFTSHKCLIF